MCRYAKVRGRHTTSTFQLLQQDRSLGSRYANEGIERGTTGTASTGTRQRRQVMTRTLLAACLAIPLATIAAHAQQITGTPGSPSATVTPYGQVLPPPAIPFGGEINLNASQSKPWWPPRAAPPKGAPNVLLIMTDDVGFGAPSTFGGVIPTPNMDRIANNGLRYTNFHSTSLCSPNAGR